MEGMDKRKKNTRKKGYERQERKRERKDILKDRRNKKSGKVSTFFILI